MATGDIIVFNEALEKMLDGDWVSTDDFYCGIIDAGVTPTKAFTTPTWSDFSGAEVTAAGTYVADGYDLGALSGLVTFSSNVMTFDSSNNPTWAQDGSNASDATWGIVYNWTDAAKDCLAFVELGTVDMSAGALTITWSGSGIYTITN